MQYLEEFDTVVKQKGEEAMLREMFICYNIQENGEILFQYSTSENCKLMQEFKGEVSTFRTIKVETENSEYFSDDAYIDICKHLGIN